MNPDVVCFYLRQAQARMSSYISCGKKKETDKISLLILGVVWIRIYSTTVSVGEEVECLLEKMVKGIRLGNGDKIWANLLMTI